MMTRAPINQREVFCSVNSLLFLVATLALVVTMMPAAVAAQEVLPFPPKPSGSKAGPTMQQSIYSPLPKVSHLPKEAPNILIVLIDPIGEEESSVTIPDTEFVAQHPTLDDEILMDESLPGELFGCDLAPQAVHVGIGVLDHEI